MVPKAVPGSGWSWILEMTSVRLQSYYIEGAPPGGPLKYTRKILDII